MSSKLYTEDEIGFERVIEIRIRNLKENKQRSFSLSIKKDAKDYASLEKLKKVIEMAVKNMG